MSQHLSEQTLQCTVTTDCWNCV